MWKCRSIKPLCKTPGKIEYGEPVVGRINTIVLKLKIRELVGPDAFNQLLCKIRHRTMVNFPQR
jgi:hypothetical protein